MAGSDELAVGGQSGPVADNADVVPNAVFTSSADVDRLFKISTKDGT
jgi:hypothetical protein